MSVSIDAGLFAKRLDILLASWNGHSSLWGDATAVVIAVGPSSEELRYLKSSALHLWLFGYELPETVMAITKSKLHVVTSAKKAAVLQGVEEAAGGVGVTMHIHIKPKGQDGAEAMAALMAGVSASGSPAKLGLLTKEKPEGQVCDCWSASCSEAGLETADVAAGLAAVLSCKDAGEVLNVKKAAHLAASCWANVAVSEIESVVDKGRKVSHRKLSERFEEAVIDPSKCQVKLKADKVDIAYPPVLQSGGRYDLKVGATNDESPLKYDVILGSIGARYSSYCANVARTVLVNPSKQQEAEYRALLAAQDEGISKLRVGNTLADLRTAVVQKLEEQGQGHLVGKLPKNLGFGMGLEFRESCNILSSSNTTPVQAGMILNVTVGVSGLRREDADTEEAKTYAMLMADTVLVKPDGAAAELLTSAALRSWKDNAYFFKGEEEEENEAADVPVQFSKAAPKMRSENPDFQHQMLDREQKKMHQSELLQKLNEETLRQGGLSRNDRGTSGRRVSEVSAFNSITDVHPPSRDLVVQVDQRHQAILVPIYGVMVPFHILTLKTASVNQDGSHAFIRLNFNFGPSYEPCMKMPEAICLKELTFRSNDARHAQKVVQEIKVLRSSVSAHEKEAAERATLVTQERLVKAKGRVFALDNVWIRPALGGKGRKMTGTLEAHSNGFRYTSPKGDTLDIMYRNIKHAFFQPAEKEMITLLHFHLHDAIMVGKKKSSDIQLYTEVMDSVQTLDGGRRSNYDPDEIEEEQKERDVRNKINRMFNQFQKRVQSDIWAKDFGELEMEFETPFRQLGFSGVPHRSTAFVMPTVNCLVELIEHPFTVITCASILLVNLERVGFNLRNFDMTIVFKDLTKDVMRIDAIPATNLDSVREWLGSMEIKYFENKVNLNWKPILKSIIEDREEFINDGGWEFLNAEGGSDAEGDDDDEDGDDEFVAEGVSDESSDDDDDSEGESVVSEDDDDSDEEASLGTDEEEGLDWDELEHRAAKDDRARGESDDEETTRKKKRARQ